MKPFDAKYYSSPYKPLDLNPLVLMLPLFTINLAVYIKLNFRDSLYCQISPCLRRQLRKISQQDWFDIILIKNSTEAYHLSVSMNTFNARTMHVP